MYGTISVNDYIEELDLSVRSYKLLRKYGCSIVSDVISIPLKKLWLDVCNKSKICFGEILIKLNDMGYRFPECSVAEYPDIQKSLSLIIQKISDVQPKPPKKKGSHPLPLGAIKNYVSFEEVINPNKSKGLFFAIADSGNHFTKYGIKEGSLLIFDRECEQADDFPCCYMDAVSDKIKLLRTAADDDQYLGRLVAVINAMPSTAGYDTSNTSGSHPVL